MTGNFNPGSDDVLNRSQLAEAEAGEAEMSGRPAGVAPRSRGFMARAILLGLGAVVPGGWLLTFLQRSLTRRSPGLDM
jgi:hypothetical protein